MAFVGNAVKSTVRSIFHNPLATLGAMTGGPLGAAAGGMGDSLLHGKNLGESLRSGLTAGATHFIGGQIAHGASSAFNTLTGKAAESAMNVAAKKAIEKSTDSYISQMFRKGLVNASENLFTKGGGAAFALYSQTQAERARKAALQSARSEEQRLSAMNSDPFNILDQYRSMIPKNSNNPYAPLKRRYPGSDFHRLRERVNGRLADGGDDEDDRNGFSRAFRGRRRSVG